MARKYTTFVALLIFLFALFPGTFELYDVTGEEHLLGQLRGLIHYWQSIVRPQPALGLNADIQPAVSGVGANTFLQNEVLPEVRDRSLRMLSNAGISYIRQEFPWEDIEIHAKNDFIDRRNPEIGDVDAWAKYDNIVQLAEQHDIEIIARLSNPPAWSRADGDNAGTQGPPDNFADFAEFAGKVATRYQDRLTYYQIWNEPNIFPEWGNRYPDPVGFTELLCQTATAIRSADPDAVIIAPALSPTIEMINNNMNDLLYLHRIYLAGAGDCFDVMSAQGYGLYSAPTDRRLYPTLINYPHSLFVRDVMVRHGDAGKPIWISELGWNALPEGMPERFGRVTEGQQAIYTVQALDRIQREWDWVGVANIWFFKRPTDREQDQPFYYFRMVEPDFTPLPVYYKVRDYNSVIRDDRMPATNWQILWLRLRSPLLLLSGGYLFFILLISLIPLTLPAIQTDHISWQRPTED